MKLSSIPDFSETESLNDSDLFLVTKKMIIMDMFQTK